MSLHYTHVDVFAQRPFSGNPLPVFVDQGPLSSDQMLAITQELRQFETIFLSATLDTSMWAARVFDLHGELPFAGHPLLGGAAVLHRATAPASPRCTWNIALPERTVTVETVAAGDGYTATIDQGRPDFLGEFDERDRTAAAFGLSVADLRADLPLVVVSTGLRYLIVPVAPGALERASVREDLTALATAAGAEFVVLFDERAREQRHWDNDGALEDVATGSAAGTIGAYCLRYGVVTGDQEFTLQQGRFLDRPSVLTVLPTGTAGDVRSVSVGGAVAFTGSGDIAVPPE